MKRKKAELFDPYLDAISFFKHLERDSPQGHDNPHVRKIVEQALRELQDELISVLNRNRVGTGQARPKEKPGS